LIYSSPKRTVKKSKIILKVRNFGDETPDKDISAFEVKNKEDLCDEKRLSLPKFPKDPCGKLQKKYNKNILILNFNISG